MNQSAQPSRVGTAFCAHAVSDIRRFIDMRVTYAPVWPVAGNKRYWNMIDAARVGTKGRAHPTWLQRFTHHKIIKASSQIDSYHFQSERKYQTENTHQVATAFR
jgi:hypothetical protein